MSFKTKRIYDPPASRDGYRLLVMRLWPRGVRKDAVDAWEKDLAPSVGLLRAYRDGKVAWAEFARRYRAGMRSRPDALDELSELARRRTVTLLCSCEDESRCHRGLLKKLADQRTA